MTNITKNVFNVCSFLRRRAVKENPRHRQRAAVSNNSYQTPRCFSDELSDDMQEEKGKHLFTDIANPNWPGLPPLDHQVHCAISGRFQC